MQTIAEIDEESKDEVSLPDPENMLFSLTGFLEMSKSNSARENFVHDGVRKTVLMRQPGLKEFVTEKHGARSVQYIKYINVGKLFNALSDAQKTIHAAETRFFSGDKKPVLDTQKQQKQKE